MRLRAAVALALLLAGQACDCGDEKVTAIEHCSSTENCREGLICVDGLCVTCTQNAHCGPGLECVAGKCAVPTCADGLITGEESDTDCGGPTCPTCTCGRRCHLAEDCVWGYCVSGVCVCEPPVCSDGRQNGDETGVDCGGSCVRSCPGCDDDLLNDPQSCGACGNVCLAPSGGAAFCSQGLCAGLCPDGKEVCGATEPSGGGVCRDLMSDAQNCGECGKVCAAAPGGAAVCVQGQCGVSCDAPLEECALECVDTDTDVRFCGDCDRACVAPPRASPVCSLGQCDFVCQDPTQRCGDQCVDTATDPSHCHDCQTRCDGPRCGFPVCVDGNCGFTCPRSHVRCGGECILPAGASCQLSVSTETACESFLDEDCDGLTDDDDPDCSCLGGRRCGLVCCNLGMACFLGSCAPDSDTDTVADPEDYCPRTPLGRKVNLGGCATEIGDVYFIQPGPGNNNGSDQGTVNAGKDSGVMGVDNFNGTFNWYESALGASAAFYCAAGYPSGANSGFFRFELSAIPAGVTLLAATLTISGGPPRDFYVRPALADWDEMTLTGQNQPAVHATLVARKSCSGGCVFDDSTGIIDVILYLLQNPNHGFRFDDNVNHIFITQPTLTSDYPSAEQRPKLEIRYKF